MVPLANGPSNLQGAQVSLHGAPSSIIVSSLLCLACPTALLLGGFLLLLINLVIITVILLGFTTIILLGILVGVLLGILFVLPLLLSASFIVRFFRKQAIQCFLECFSFALGTDLLGISPLENPLTSSGCFPAAEISSSGTKRCVGKAPACSPTVGNTLFGGVIRSMNTAGPGLRFLTGVSYDFSSFFTGPSSLLTAGDLPGSGIRACWNSSCQTLSSETCNQYDAKVFRTSIHACCTSASAVGMKGSCFMRKSSVHAAQSPSPGTLAAARSLCFSQSWAFKKPLAWLRLSSTVFLTAIAAAPFGCLDMVFKTSSKDLMCSCIWT